MNRWTTGVTIGLVVSLGMNLPVQDPATSNTISIPADTYTFPEITDLLSKSGSHIICSRTLKNHAAVIYLKNRSFESAISVIGSGLDVQFRPTDNVGKSFVMETSKVVLTREKPWLFNLAQELLKSNEKDLITSKITSNATHAQVVNRALALATLLKRVENTDPDHKLESTIKLEEEASIWLESSTPQGWLGRLLQLKMNVQTILDTIQSNQPFIPIDSRSIYDVASIKRLRDYTKREMEAEIAKRILENDPNPNGADAQNAENLRQLDPPGPVAYYRPEFDADGLFFNLKTITYCGGSAVLTSDSFLNPIPIVSEDLVDSSVAFGMSYKLWKDKLRKQQPQILNSIQTDTLIPVNDRDRTTSLSQIVQRWAEVTRHETVMELAPIRETVDLPATDRNRRKGVTLAVHTTTLRKSLKDHDWTIDVKEGVALFHDEWACVDRYQNYPFASMLQMEKRMSSDDPQVPWNQRINLDDLVTFHQTINHVESARLYKLVEPYRGWRYTDVAISRPVCLAVKNLSNSDRNRALQTIMNKKDLDLPMLRFGQSALQNIADAIREMAFSRIDEVDSEESIQDNLPVLLSQMKLHFGASYMDRISSDTDKTHEFIGSISGDRWKGVDPDMQRYSEITIGEMGFKNVRIPKPK